MKSIVIPVTIAIGLILIAVFLVGGNNNNADNLRQLNGGGNGGSNVSMVDGKQIIEIRAKGGYLPRKSVAKAGVPTVLRFNTSGTFDCSSSVRIPSMRISKLLPQTGVTDIDIGTPETRVLQGSCGMGMYPFEVSFKE